ncbi:13366_t:CDS:2, partial [Ambispora leptoticha]
MAVKNTDLKRESIELLMDTSSKITETNNNNTSFSSNEALIPKLKTSTPSIGQLPKNVVAIFVVRFDTKHGNTIEWQHPKDFDLNGVEFSAMPSGLHLMKKDIIYFVRPPYIGLSVYENVPTFDQSQDRGAHMAAVGILVTKTSETEIYGQPWRHVEFLQSQVRQHVNVSSDYSVLEGFFSEHGCLKNNHGNDNIISRSLLSSSSPRHSLKNTYFSASMMTAIGSNGIINDEISYLNHQELSNSPSHPAHHFSSFIQYFGPSIFVLWKAAILNKRILYYSAPPVETGCHFVYGTCQLVNFSDNIKQIIHGGDGAEKNQLQPLFNIGVHEIDMIKSMKNGVVACTTDRIFQSKQNLYDLLINFSSETAEASLSNTTSFSSAATTSKSSPSFVPSPDPSSLMQKLITLNSADFQRYRDLSKLLGPHGDNNREEEWRQYSLIEHWQRILNNWLGGYGGGNTSNIGYLRLNNIDDEDGDEARVSRDIAEDGTFNSLTTIVPPKDAHDIEIELTNYFNTLTSNLLSELNSMITTLSVFESDDDHLISIYPEHMSTLGLDARADCLFIKELCRIYFGKEVQVVGTGSGRVIVGNEGMVETNVLYTLYDTLCMFVEM